MRRILISTAVVLMAAAAGVLAAPALAGAQTAGGGGCTQIEATLSKINATLPQAASNPTALKSKITTFAKALETEAASAPSAVQKPVATFVTALRAAGAGHPNVSALTADGNAIGAACAAAGSPPATGGGSTAGLQDGLLIGLGIAVVLAGAAVLGMAERRRRAGA